MIHTPLHADIHQKFTLSDQTHPLLSVQNLPSPSKLKLTIQQLNKWSRAANKYGKCIFGKEITGKICEYESNQNNMHFCKIPSHEI